MYIRTMKSFIKGFSLMLFMPREKLIKLLFELVKNSKRTDRDIAKKLGISQPSISRLRKVLEREAILQYTLIPNLPYLGFDVVAFTFVRSKKLVDILVDKGKKWTKEQPNVVYASTGHGIDADALVISVHKDYADFVRFYQNFRRDWGEHLEDFKTFFISIKGSFTLKHFSFNFIADAYQKEV